MTVPHDILDRLKLREGWSDVVYLDTKGLPTAGMGHLLKPSEQHSYPVKSVVPEDVLTAWQSDDTIGAYNAAVQQAHMLGVTDERLAALLVAGLTHVNFQLGSAWWTIYKKTWALLKAHQWAEAADEAARSTWAKQTPIRVKDFQQALLSLVPSNTPKG